uniref:Major ampullate spidroin 1 n=1 Tax=Araneus ventricosus TaxID=182803 RepID=A0A6M3YGA9_ARAVE|nr:major ampullate spidroin 1 [Araneus ventricosus]
MTWTARLALSLLAVICSQSLFALGQSPWQNARMAENFMSSFSTALGQSQAFSSDQMDDIMSICDSIQSGVDRMDRSGKTSANKLQAMNMAFASAVAEIAIAEGGGQSAQVKTNAVADALASAFLQTTGVVNTQFVNEIRTLISMFAQANAVSSSSSSVSASTGGAGGYGPQAQGAASAAVSASAQGGYGPGPQGPTGRGPQGPGPQTQGTASVSVSAAAPGGYGQGPQSYGPGPQGPSGPGQQGPYGPGQQGPSGPGPQGPGQSSYQYSISINSQSGSQGPTGGQGAASSAAAASAAASRLSSPSAASRVSSAVSSLVSSGGPSSPAALSSTISNVVSQISASNPGLSGCDVLVQALLEIVSALVHILGSANIGQVNSSAAGQSASLVGQSVYQALS